MNKYSIAISNFFDIIYLKLGDEMKKKTAISYVLLAGILWGVISLFINKLNEYGLSGIEISLLRVSSCSVIMFFFLLIYDKSLLKIKLKDVWLFIGTGIISLTLFSMCYFTTIINVEASIAVCLLYTSPIFVMIFSAFLFKEKINVQKIIAIILTIGGCIFISGIAGNGIKMTPTAFLIGLCSGFFYALYSIFGRYATDKYSPFTITFYTFVFATIGFLIIIRPTHAIKVMINEPKSIIYALLSSVLCAILPYIFYTFGLKHLNTSEAGILVAVEPLVGCVVGIVAFNETTSFLKILGIILILSSIIILSIEPKKLRKQ